MAMDIAPKWLEWGRQKSAELLPQYKGQLPFVVMDADDPRRIISFWQVEDTGNELDDLARGGIFAELLVQRAKHWRDRGDLRIDPFQIIHEVLIAIASKGNPGAVERGFLGRISILALAASLN